MQHFIRLATWAPEAVMRGEAVDAIALVLRSWRFRDSGTEDRKYKSVCSKRKFVGGTGLKTFFVVETAMNNYYVI